MEAGTGACVRDIRIPVTRCRARVGERTDRVLFCDRDFVIMSGEAKPKKLKRLYAMSTGGRGPKPIIGVRPPLLPDDERHPDGSDGDGVAVREQQVLMDFMRKSLLSQCASRGITKHTEEDLVWCGMTSWLASVVHDKYVAKIPDKEEVRFLLGDICRDLVVWELSVVGKNFKSMPSGPFVMGDFTLETEDKDIPRYPGFIEDVVTFLMKWLEVMVWVRAMKGKDVEALGKCARRLEDHIEKNYHRDGKVRLRFVGYNFAN